jgi:hypothetical protein
VSPIIGKHRHGATGSIPAVVPEEEHTLHQRDVVHGGGVAMWQGSLLDAAVRVDDLADLPLSEFARAAA